MTRVKVKGPWKPLEDAVIDWMPELRRRYGTETARQMVLVAVVINRYYRRDIGKVHRMASQHGVIEHLGMSRRYFTKLTDNLIEVGLLKRYGPRATTKGGRPPKMFRLADPVPEPPLEVKGP